MTDQGFGFFFDTSFAWWGDATNEWPPPIIDNIPAPLTYAAITECIYEASFEGGGKIRFHRCGLAAICSEDYFRAFQFDRREVFDRFDDLVIARARQVQLLNALSITISSTSDQDDTIPWIAPRLITADNIAIIGYDDASRLRGVSGSNASAELSEKFKVVVPAPAVVPTSLIATASANFSEIIGHTRASEVLPISALLNEATVAYHAHNFSLAMVTAWSICERMQNILWEKYYEVAATRSGRALNREIRGYLQGRDFTASIVGTILEFAGVLPLDLKDQLDQGRKARNKWLHAGLEPSSEGAASCITAATRMIQMVYGIEFRIPLNLSIHF